MKSFSDLPPPPLQSPASSTSSPLALVHRYSPPPVQLTQPLLPATSLVPFPLRLTCQVRYGSSPTSLTLTVVLTVFVASYLVGR